MSKLLKLLRNILKGKLSEFRVTYLYCFVHDGEDSKQQQG
jgi:hypothetical protein